MLKQFQCHLIKHVQCLYSNNYQSQAFHGHFQIILFQWSLWRSIYSSNTNSCKLKCLNSKSWFVKLCGNDRLSNIWPKYILLSSLKFSRCQLSKQGADRSIKVTTLSKQICIKNKINLSSVNWKFKEDLEQVLTSLNGSNLKSAPFNWNYCWNKSKQFKNCFIYCPKLNKGT